MEEWPTVGSSSSKRQFKEGAGENHSVFKVFVPPTP